MFEEVFRTVEHCRSYLEHDGIELKHRVESNDP